MPSRLRSPSSCWSTATPPRRRRSSPPPCRAIAAGRRGGPPGGSQGARGAIWQLLSERGVGRAFARDVQREAGRAAERGGGAAAARRDLRDLATFTIDPIGARDFDDAISAQSLAESEVRVWVHIADVSAFVEEGSALDLEARRRATSVYVPDA